jgi:two-component system, NarL family, nitrate/nitrite response regulator NarL
MIRILIADDNFRYRIWLRKLLANQSDWEICDDAADGQQAVAHAGTFQPQVIILDVQMPVMNGFDAARLILQTLPRTLILMQSLDREYAQLAKDRGAHGFLPKDDADELLIPVISALLRGEFYFPSIPAD